MADHQNTNIDEKNAHLLRTMIANSIQQYTNLASNIVDSLSENLVTIILNNAEMLNKEYSMKYEEELEIDINKLSDDEILALKNALYDLFDKEAVDYLFLKKESPEEREKRLRSVAEENKRLRDAAKKQIEIAKKLIAS